MMDNKERARRDEAHAAADMAWSLAHKRSRTAGLGDAVRSIGTSAPSPRAVRKLRQDLHRQKQRDAAVKALKWTDEHRPWNPRAGDRSKYFPHQSERETARRMAALPDKKP